MTDRDEFAAAALTGLLADDGDRTEHAMPNFTARAYEWADAMLRERDQTNLDAVPDARDDGSTLGNPVPPVPVTGNTPKPVAWAVVRWWDNAISLFCFEKAAAEKHASEASDDTCHRHDVIPLYRDPLTLYIAPQPTTTDAEGRAPQQHALTSDERFAIRYCLTRTLEKHLVGHFRKDEQDVCIHGVMLKRTLLDLIDRFPCKPKE